LFSLFIFFLTLCEQPRSKVKKRIKCFVTRERIEKKTPPRGLCKKINLKETHKFQIT